MWAEIQAHHHDMVQGLAGLSLPARIVHALVEAGFMEEPDQPEHNHFTPEPSPGCPACEGWTGTAIEAYAKRMRPKSTPTA